MAEVVRHLTSIPIAEFVKQQFFEPLGLTATTVNHTAAAESGNLAVPYLRKDVFARGCQDQSTEGHNVNPRCFGDPIPTEWYAKGSGLHAPGPVVSSFTDMVSNALRFAMSTNLVTLAQMGQGAARSKIHPAARDSGDPSEYRTRFQ